MLAQMMVMMPIPLAGYLHSGLQMWSLLGWSPLVVVAVDDLISLSGNSGRRDFGGLSKTDYNSDCWPSGAHEVGNCVSCRG